MIRIDYKPLSINQCWQGKRFKTPAYTIYESSLLYLLPNSIKVPKDKKLCLELNFGLSSKNADWDNPIKAFVDILQKKYQFNDKQIYEAHVTKVDVKKGEEFIEFDIK